MLISGQDVITFAAGIGGTLGTIKLIRFIASRRKGPDEEDQPKQGETVKEYKQRLFPNGEKDEILLRIDELAQANRDVNRAVIALESCTKAQGKAIADIDERLAKGGL